jgi:hypothetical protein
MNTASTKDGLKNRLSRADRRTRYESLPCNGGEPRNARACGTANIAERKERRDRDNKSEQPKHDEDAGYSRTRSPITPAIVAPLQHAGEADGKQAADR